MLRNNLKELNHVYQVKKQSNIQRASGDPWWKYHLSFPNIDPSVPLMGSLSTVKLPFRDIVLTLCKSCVKGERVLGIYD